ncbi:phage virion morphogenesis protein [Aeromonas veronii]
MPGDPEGSPWAPLSEKYRARKPRHADEVLHLNDNLRDTLNYQAEPQTLYFGTPMVCGAAHQFGREETHLQSDPIWGLSRGGQERAGDAGGLFRHGGSVSFWAPLVPPCGYDGMSLSIGQEMALNAVERYRRPQLYPPIHPVMQ